MELSCYLNRIVRMALLVLGILSVPSIRLGAAQRPHCSKHEPSSSGHDQAVPVHAMVLQPGSRHECPHCPATECAHLVPCSATTSLVLAAASCIAAKLLPQEVGLPALQCHAHSRTHEPPTPPPQLIA
jgi:hypothetical protein